MNWAIASKPTARHWEGPRLVEVQIYAQPKGITLRNQPVQPRQAHCRFLPVARQQVVDRQFAQQLMGPDRVQAWPLIARKAESGQCPSKPGSPGTLP